MMDPKRCPPGMYCRWFGTRLRTISERCARCKTAYWESRGFIRFVGWKHRAHTMAKRAQEGVE